MRTLVLIVIALCIVIVAMDVATFVQNETEGKPDQAFIALTQYPAHGIADAKRNGYFLLLGFSADSTQDPLQTGFDIWLEAEADRGHLFYNYLKPGRIGSRVAGKTLDTLQAWNNPDAGIRFGKDRLDLKAPRSRDAALMDRYQRWLTMPFEDWGYGHLGSPRFIELFLTHRLYVIDGFMQHPVLGADRLSRDLYAWRSVLGEAKTLPVKLMAAVIVDDDVRLASGILTRRDADAAALNRLKLLGRPLNRIERSLRWPVQNEFLTAVSRYERSIPPLNAVNFEDARNNKHWLANVAGLEQDAFERVEHPLSANALARGSYQRKRATNTYAHYYEATIRAADLPHAYLPKLKDFTGGPARAFLDYLVNPVDNVFESGFEPDWQPFIDRMSEVDARLRLLGLQARLRGMRTVAAAHRDIADAGDEFYDPFSGLPMLFNGETNRLYSVGRDGKDDNGDPRQDIAVTIPPPQAFPPPSVKAAPKSR
jgi:hypothetical protein